MRYKLKKRIVNAARALTVLFVIAAFSLSISATAKDQPGADTTPQCGAIGVAEPVATYIT